MPRATKLTVQKQNAIAAHVRQGHTFGVACRLEGISEATGRSWLARGRGTSDREAKDIYVKFAEAISLASAQAEQACIKGILDVGLKGWTTKTVKVTKKDGMTITETTTSKVRNWQALAWIAERYWPHKYGKYRMPEQEAAKILMDANWVPESFAEAASEVGEIVESHMQDAYRQTSGNGNGSTEFVPPPDPMKALDALVHAGWIPHSVRRRIARTPESDRADVARQVLSELMEESISEETQESENPENS